MTRACALSLLTVLGGCAWKPRPLSDDAVQTLAPYLEVGRTRRDDLPRRFGRPSFEAPDAGVVSYRLTLDGFGTLTVIRGEGAYGWNLVQYNLILAFDARQILEERALIQLKAGSSW